MLLWHVASIKINVSSEVIILKKKNMYLGPNSMYAVIWAFFLLFWGDTMLVLSRSVSVNNIIVRNVYKNRNRNKYMRLETRMHLKPCPSLWQLGVTAVLVVVLVVGQWW